MKISEYNKAVEKYNVLIDKETKIENEMLENERNYLKKRLACLDKIKNIRGNKDYKVFKNKRELEKMIKKEFEVGRIKNGNGN